MQEIWLHGEIAACGYFDAHDLFSLLVILAISNTLSPSDEDQDAIDLSRILLTSMVDQGNLSAKECSSRLARLEQELCAPEVGTRLGISSSQRGDVQGQSHLGSEVQAQNQISSIGQSHPTWEPFTSFEELQTEQPRSTVFEDLYLQEFLEQPDRQMSPTIFDPVVNTLGSFSHSTEMQSDIY